MPKLTDVQVKIMEEFTDKIKGYLNSQAALDHLSADPEGISWIKKLNNPDDIVEGLKRFLPEEYIEELQGICKDDAIKKALPGLIKAEVAGSSDYISARQRKGATNTSIDWGNLDITFIDTLHEKVFYDPHAVNYLKSNRDNVNLLKKSTTTDEIIGALEKLMGPKYAKDLRNTIAGILTTELQLAFVKATQRSFVKGFEKALTAADLPSLDAPTKENKGPILRQLGSAKEKAKAAGTDAANTLRNRLKPGGKSRADQ